MLLSASLSHAQVRYQLSSVIISWRERLLAHGTQHTAVFPTLYAVPQTTSLLSTVWMHATVTGVAFCGPTFDDVAAVAYDTDELQLYKPLHAT
jgi:hypothetical protein